jgi:hypothetical protein
VPFFPRKPWGSKPGACWVDAGFMIFDDFSNPSTKIELAVKCGFYMWLSRPNHKTTIN